MSEMYAKDLVLIREGNDHSLSTMMNSISSMLSDIYGVLCTDPDKKDSFKDMISFVPLGSLSYISSFNIHHKHNDINYVCTFDKDNTLKDLHDFLEKKHNITAIERIIDESEKTILYDQKRNKIKGYHLIFPRLFEIKDRKDIGDIGIIIFDNTFMDKLVGKKRKYGLYFSKLPKNIVPVFESLTKYRLFSI
ncbi:MAG: hypothetical protein KAI18_00205 [Candidatus Aenigmarchaeota archaeon]|nr:hypothetical protein [Candidatus Aenigmarchaeota archaeon]